MFATVSIVMNHISLYTLHMYRQQMISKRLRLMKLTWIMAQCEMSLLGLLRNLFPLVLSHVSANVVHFFMSNLLLLILALLADQCWEGFVKHFK